MLGFYRSGAVLMYFISLQEKFWAFLKSSNFAKKKYGLHLWRRHSFINMNARKVWYLWVFIVEKIYLFWELAPLGWTLFQCMDNYLNDDVCYLSFNRNSTYSRLNSYLPGWCEIFSALEREYDPRCIIPVLGLIISNITLSVVCYFYIYYTCTYNVILL